LLQDCHPNRIDFWYVFPDPDSSRQDNSSSAAAPIMQAQHERGFWTYPSRPAKREPSGGLERTAQSGWFDEAGSRRLVSGLL
jgi:hypothetical protein